MWKEYRTNSNFEFCKDDNDIYEVISIDNENKVKNISLCEKISYFLRKIFN